MRSLAVTLVLSFLVCGTLAGVARRDVKYPDLSSLIKENKVQTKVKVVLHDPKDDVDFIAEEPEKDDTKIELPERDARFLSLTPINQVSAYVKNLIPRGEVIRPMTRQFVGVVQGREECWQKTLCQAGKMLVGFRQTPDFLNTIEQYTPMAMKEAIEIMKRSAIDGDDCSSLVCSV